MLRELPSLVLVLGVIPFLWSALLVGLRAAVAHRSSSVDSMRLEVAVLGLMILPVALSVAALVSAPLAPDAPLPVFDLDEIGWAGPEKAAARDAGAVSAPTSARLSWSGAALTIMAIYLAGLGVAILRLARSRVRLDWIARSGAPAPDLGPCVRLTESAVPPFASACGAIVLPRTLAAKLAAHELALIIRHERAHLDRGDPRSFWMLAWIDALFWPNAFVRRQTARCRLAAELACDAAVTAGAPGDRAAYPGALVAALKHVSTGAPTEAPGILSTRSKGEHRMRIAEILGVSPPRRRLARTTAAGAALLLLPVGALQLAACASGDAQPSPEAPSPAPSTLEIVAEEGGGVRVERVDDTLVRLTGPLRIRSGPGDFELATDHVDVQLQRDDHDDAGAADPQTPDWIGARFSAAPMQGRVVSAFGERIDPFTGEKATHHGIDLQARQGDPIYAAADGEVSFVGWRGGYGRVVEIAHAGNVKTRAAHLQTTEVEKGERVTAGQVIGRAGQTGRTTVPAGMGRLHWEVWYAGKLYDPGPVLEAVGFVDQAP